MNVNDDEPVDGTGGATFFRTNNHWGWSLKMLIDPGHFVMGRALRLGPTSWNSLQFLIVLG